MQKLLQQLKSGVNPNPGGGGDNFTHSPVGFPLITQKR